MQNKNPKSLFGIDINEYTENVKFPILATKIDFLYLRSSGSGSGRFRVDKKFIEFAKESISYKIPVGAYHFGVPSYDLTDADRQCDDFINVLQQGFGENNYGDLFPVLDIEVPIDKSISTKILVSWIDRFRNRFERKTRRRLMLYTGLFFIEMYDDFYVKGKGYPLKNMPLWLAMYTKVAINPPVPPNIGGWTRWRIWQYSEDQKISGVGNPLDANWGPNNISLLTQPSIVNNFKINENGDKLYLSWDRVPDIDLLGYNLFINGNWIVTVDENTTKYVLDKNKLGISKGQTSIISIEAFDYDGETSKTRTKVKMQI